MVIKTTKTLWGVTYDYACSDEGRMVERDGVRYCEALDPLGSGRVYTETEEPIDSGMDEAAAEDYQSALAEFGVDV